MQKQSEFEKTLSEKEKKIKEVSHQLSIIHESAQNVQNSTTKFLEEINTLKFKLTSAEQKSQKLDEEVTALREKLRQGERDRSEVSHALAESNTKLKSTIADMNEIKLKLGLTQEELSVL